jgi:hypothetical protein
MDFWRSFGRGLGCEDPKRTIASHKEQMRSVAYLGTIGMIIGLSVLSSDFYLSQGDTLVAIVIWVIAIVWTGALIVSPLAKIDRARQVASILGQGQEPFWLTGGSIALSNLGITPPTEAKSWWPDRLALVFVQHLATRFSVDAFTGNLIWESAIFQAAPGYYASLSVQTLKDLLSANPRYRQMVNTFQGLAGLESDFTFLQDLKAEAERGLATELREAEKRAAKLRREAEEHEGRRKAPEASQARPTQADDEKTQRPNSEAQIERLTWNDLIIEDKLREKLQTYCEILRQAKLFCSSTNLRPLLTILIAAQTR